MIPRWTWRKRRKLFNKIQVVVDSVCGNKGLKKMAIYAISKKKSMRGKMLMIGRVLRQKNGSLPAM
jgi:hypothetical protein